jgi:hypothetical protein
MKQGLLGKALGAGLLAGTLAFAAPAWAAGYCSAGMATGGIATDNLSFEAASADDCYGVVGGNINGKAGKAALNGLNWGSGWAYLDATDAAGARFRGIDFVISATPGSAGSFTLTGTDSNGTAPLNLPAVFDFVVGLKGGAEYALWGFDNVMVSGANNGSFSIEFSNRGGNFPELSHMIVFGREGGRGTVSAVPETDTRAMLLAGLGLVGFAARRKLG